MRPDCEGRGPQECALIVLLAFVFGEGKRAKALRPITQEINGEYGISRKLGYVADVTVEDSVVLKFKRLR